MENHDLADISSSSAPYQYNLANSWAQSTNFQYESNAGSLPNYIAATSGSTQGIIDDGNPGSHPLSVTNIVDRLEGAGLTWKAYMEGMPSTNICNGGGSTDGGTNYIAHHDAFAYYTDITGNSARCAKVVQAGTSGGASSCTTSMPSGLASTLLSDLGSTSTASNFIWLQPNNYDNSHDCSPNVGSAYLQAIVPSILSSTVFTTQKAVLLITYDEGHDTCCPDPIYTVFAGPQAKTSYSSGANTYNHYSLLRTIEDNWSFSCLSNDCSSPNMDEFLINPILPPPSSLFDYIVWIMMENHDLADISSSSAPYQYNLANSWAQSTNFQYESNAGSLYNYIAATSGSMNGITCDGSPNSGCVLPNPGVQNIVDRLAGKSLSWKAYMEGMPTSNICTYGSAAYSDGSGNNYQAHHDPFVYYSDVYNNSTRCARVIQAGSSSGAASCTTTMPPGVASNLLNDLQSTTTASNLMWLTPNNYDNTHDCTPSVGSAYLQAIVPSILSSTVFTTQKAVLLITYDEGHDTCCPDPIYTVFAGPQAKTSYSSGANTYNHYSILKTIETNWGLASLTSNDGGASGMTEFFASSAPVSGSWNPNVACTPQTVRISDITNNMTGTRSYNNSRYSPGITENPPVPSSEGAKRWLSAGAVPGATPPGWVSPGPSCVINNLHGQMAASFVEIDGVGTSGMTYETDCSTAYDSANGGGAQPAGHWCDDTFNIFDPSLVSNYGTSCTSATDPTCYGRMHLEFDQDWMAAGYCGPSTSYCNNNTLAQTINPGSSTTLFDFQGFIFWDPDHLTANWHSFSGWELHALTGWKSHPVTAPLNPPYKLTFQGYDYDGAYEETLTLNNQLLAQLPTVDSPQNAGIYVSFTVNNLPVVKGTNTLVFTHASWDCGVTDTTKNVQITDGAPTVIFSDPTARPLSCTQSITYTFTV